MLRKIEYLIPAALDAVENVLAPKYPNGIPSGYQSAISGFGTSLMQMGLLPTLAVYTDRDSEADIRRDLLLKALFHIVIHENGHFPESGKSLVPRDNHGHTNTDQLLRSVAHSAFPKEELKEHLMQAALAFKLAIRTFKLIKK